METRLLAMIGEARRNRDGADPAAFFADWAARHRDAGHPALGDGEAGPP